MNLPLADSLTRASEKLNRGPLAQSYGRLKQINGMVLSVEGGNYTLGHRYQVENIHGEWCDAQVIGLDGDTAFLMPLDRISELATNARVRDMPQSRHLIVGDGLLGRVIDGLGRPLDQLPPFTNGKALTPSSSSFNPMDKKGVTGPLDVGIKTINSLFTVGKGQRLGLFSGSGVGKSKLLGMMTRFTKADVVIVSLVGERGWEVREFIHDSLGEEGLKKSVVVAAPADHSPLMRMQSAELAHQLAAWYRDQGKHVLLLVDSLTRYAQAQREIALSAGEPPATKGYPPSVFSKLTHLVEMAGNSIHSEGTMTAIYTVLAEGDDQQDPIVDGARAILDGHIILTRELAEQGHYPAIDIGASISRVMPNIVPTEQLHACYRLKRLDSRYKQVQELIPLGAYQFGIDTELDNAVKLYPKIREFLSQGLDEQCEYEATLQELIALVGNYA